MSKKLLVISSSPRKQGNSDLLCDEFIKGAAEAGNQTEKIFLGDSTIHYCTGCGLCNSQKGRCSQKDDMAGIREKMISADAILFATPIYFYTMAGQMKTFLDRNCSFYTELTHKDFYLIMTAADTDSECMDRTVTEFGGYFSCLTDPHVKGIIRGTGAWQTGEIRTTKFMKEACELGRSL